MSTPADALTPGGGIDGLIKSLEERNRSLAEQHGLQQGEDGRKA